MDTSNLSIDALGFDELVDTAADILETADLIGGALSDGFQITDLGVLLSVAPKAAEIKRDGKQAVNELLDLDADEAAKAASAIAERTGKPTTGIINRVNEAFTLSARTYRQVTDGYNLVQDWARWGRSLRNVNQPIGV